MPYDDQQTVYETMINDLTAAVATLTEHRSSNLNATADYVYGGKVDKWIKFGNSLKLRLAMRIVNVDREFARTAAESAVNHEVGVFEDNSDNARDFYEEGIKLSFEQYGVSGADEYLKGSSPVTVSYTDPWTEKNPNGTVVGPIIAPCVQWREDSDMQKRIITQKWIANWILGNEAWSDYRRTGYPELFPASDAGNLSNGVVDSSRGARRMPYPQEEYTNNSEYMQEALSLLDGPDDMGTDLWWARKK